MKKAKTIPARVLTDADLAMFKTMTRAIFHAADAVKVVNPSLHSRLMDVGLTFSLAADMNKVGDIMPGEQFAAMVGALVLARKNRWSEI